MFHPLLWVLTNSRPASSASLVFLLKSLLPLFCIGQTFSPLSPLATIRSTNPTALGLDAHLLCADACCSQPTSPPSLLDVLPIAAGPTPSAVPPLYETLGLGASLFSLLSSSGKESVLCRRGQAHSVVTVTPGGSTQSICWYCFFHRHLVTCRDSGVSQPTPFFHLQ